MFDSDVEVLHRHAGPNGLIYTEKVDDLSDDEYLLSECGEVVRPKDLKDFK